MSSMENQRVRLDPGESVMARPRTTQEELRRQLGLTVRAGVQAPFDMVSPFTDPLALAAGAVTGKKVPTAQELGSAIADWLGTPTPVTGIERGANVAARAMAGGAMGTAAVPRIAPMGAKSIPGAAALEMVNDARTPGTLAQATGGAVGGYAASEAAGDAYSRLAAHMGWQDQGGVGAGVAGLAGGLVGGLGSGMAVGRAPAVARRVAANAMAPTPMNTATRRQAGVFGGPSAKYADLDALQRAVEMERKELPDGFKVEPRRAGVPYDHPVGRDARKKIWQETGWFRGPDGAWRFEIPDNEMKFSQYQRFNTATDLKGGNEGNFDPYKLYRTSSMNATRPDETMGEASFGRFGDVITDANPKGALAQYPQLNKIDVKMRGGQVFPDDPKKKGRVTETLGEYMPGIFRGGSGPLSNNKITQDLDGRYINMWSTHPLDSPTTMDGFKHETQHAIDDLEYRIPMWDMDRISGFDNDYPYLEKTWEKMARLAQRRGILTPEERKQIFPMDQLGDKYEQHAQAIADRDQLVYGLHPSRQVVNDPMMGRVGEIAKMTEDFDPESALAYPPRVNRNLPGMWDNAMENIGAAVERGADYNVGRAMRDNMAALMDAQSHEGVDFTQRRNMEEFWGPQYKGGTMRVGGALSPEEIALPKPEKAKRTRARKNDTLANEPSPQKTVRAFKQFVQDADGNLRPLFIGERKPVPIGEWVPAENNPTKGFAPRPGWHAGELPYAPQLRDKSGMRQGKRVWAEVEMPADVDWQSTASATKTRDIRDRVPEGGHYTWERPGSQGGKWLIGGAMKVNRVLTDQEVGGLLRAAGRPDDARAETRGLANAPDAGPPGLLYGVGGETMPSKFRAAALGESTRQPAYEIDAEVGPPRPIRVPGPRGTPTPLVSQRIADPEFAGVVERAFRWGDDFAKRTYAKDDPLAEWWDLAGTSVEEVVGRRGLSDYSARTAATAPNASVPANVSMAGKATARTLRGQPSGHIGLPGVDKTLAEIDAGRYWDTNRMAASPKITEMQFATQYDSPVFDDLRFAQKLFGMEAGGSGADGTKRGGQGFTRADHGAVREYMSGLHQRIAPDLSFKEFVARVWTGIVPDATPSFNDSLAGVHAQRVERATKMTPQAIAKKFDDPGTNLEAEFQRVTGVPLATAGKKLRLSRAQVIELMRTGAIWSALAGVGLGGEEAQAD